MPYQHIHDLPDAVRHVLPEHAQDIFLKSFNHAYEEYQHKEKRLHPDDDLETVCYKVAWSAVKRK